VPGGPKAGNGLDGQRSQRTSKAKAAKLTTANRSVGDDEYKLSVRRASVEEATLFGQAAASAKPSNDLVLAYLVELDG
jgi:hypothetical protein